MATVRKKKPTKAQIAEARRLYEETNVSQTSIAASLGISPPTLKSRAVEWGWTLRGRRAASGAGKNSSLHGPGEKPDLPPQGESEGAIQDHATGADDPVALKGRSCTGLPACPERSALVRKLWASAARQVARIDAAHAEFVGRGQPLAAEAEGHAKLIATLARSLRELAALDSMLQDKSPQEQAANDPSAGFNADALRDELAKRLAALDARATQGAAGRAEPAGN